MSIAMQDQHIAQGVNLALKIYQKYGTHGYERRLKDIVTQLEDAQYKDSKKSDPLHVSIDVVQSGSSIESIAQTKLSEQVVVHSQGSVGLHVSGNGSTYHRSLDEDINKLLGISD